MGILQEITTEPVVILYTVFFYMVKYTQQQFFETKICSNLHHKTSTNETSPCIEIDRTSANFTEIADKTEDLLSYIQLVETAIPLLVVVVLGPLSDSYGRKWFLLVNLIGNIFLPVGYLLLYLLDNVPTFLLILPSIAASLTGLDAVFTNTVFSYAGDVSYGKSTKSASIRFILIDTISNLISPVGLYGGNFILNLGGFSLLFLFTSGLLVLSAVYVAVRMINIIPEQVKTENVEEYSLLERGINFIKKLFACILVVRDGYKRAIVNLLLLNLGIHAITYTCDFNVCFIFLQTKFGFSESSFSDLQSLRMLLAGIGSLLIVGLVNLSSINVLVLGIIGCISRIAYYLEYSLANHIWVLHLGNILGSIGGTIPSICKIVITNIVHPSELGKINTFVAILEALIPVACVPVFDYFWKMSSENFPGLDFLITSFILVIIFIIFLLVSVLSFCQKKRSNQ